MSNNKQSSLDYYITKLTEILGLYIQQISRDDNERIARLEEQAKAMHKEEIRVAYMEGAFEKMRHLDGKEFMMPTDYYNETFNK